MTVLSAILSLLAAGAQFLLPENLPSSSQTILSSVQKTRPFVDLDYAKYEGIYNSTLDISSFFGVRYADAPTGQYRWQKPRPPPEVDEVQDASQYAPWCPQNLALSGQEGKPISEDCLFLDIYVPGFLDSRNNPPADFPVVVYIFGGGYTIGSAELYDGSYLVQQSNHQAIAVIIQYRLNVFGFLPGSAIKEGGVLNAGLWDQHFSLQWVQEHIGAFGGNPSSVTIWGSSAGGGSVLQHVLTPVDSEQTLFNKIITCSLHLGSLYDYDDLPSEAMYEDVITEIGCDEEPDPLECLRKKDLDDFDPWIDDPVKTTAFYFVVDGDFIQTRPYEALSKRDFNGNAYLATINTNEALYIETLQLQCDDDTDIEELVHLQIPLLTDLQLAVIMTLYRGFEPGCRQASQIIGEFQFICPTYQTLLAFSEAPNKKTWKGELAVLPAYHGDELPYIFNDTNLSLSNHASFENIAFEDAFAQPFMSFAVYEDPNVKFDPPNILPHWQHWTTENYAEIRFNKTDGAEPYGKPWITRVRTDPATLFRCAIWKLMSPSLLQ